MMRPYLVTTFYCAKCGAAINLTYDKPEKSLECVSDGITGGSKVELRVFVEPCKKCLQPVEDIRHALKALVRITEEK